MQARLFPSHIFSNHTSISFLFPLPSSLPFFFPPSLSPDGMIGNSNGRGKVANELVNEGDRWEMEVDLRSEDPEKRTLHWFIRGKQQKGFFKGIHNQVEFGVCYYFFSSFLTLFYYTLPLLCIFNNPISGHNKIPG